MLRGISILACCALLAACNGLPGSASGELPDARPSGTLTGYVVDAPIAGALVTVYALTTEGKGERLGGATTDESGHYSISIQGEARPLWVEAMGGRYTEQASQAEVALREDQALRSVGMYRPGETISLMVSPFTHVAAGLARFKLNQGLAPGQAIDDAVAQVSEIFGVDVVATRPRDITDPNNTDHVVDEEYLYGFQLAGLSSWTQWASRQNGTEPHSVYTSVAFSQIAYNDISADGLLNGQTVDEKGEKTPLAFGVVRLHADTYRLTLAQHMMAMVSRPENRTAITVSDLLDNAQRLASSRSTLFGDGGSFGDGRPSVVSIGPDGMFYNGVFSFPVAVRGLVSVAEVEFYVDDEYAGVAEDVFAPAVAIDSSRFADGEYEILAIARDELGNEASGRFLVRIDNTAPFINVTSPTLTNRAKFELTGNFGDNGAGVRSIRVAGADVPLLEDNTWRVELTLQEGNNIFPVVLTDRLGNAIASEAVVELDTVPPAIKTGPHAKARFSDGSGGYREAFLENSNDRQPLYLETAFTDLDGVPITRQNLDENHIPYFALTAYDQNASNAGSLRAEMRYVREPDIASDWRPLPPVEGEYLIPLASEMLHPDWNRVSPQDTHQLQVRITDAAGNQAEMVYAFRADFVVSPFDVSPAADKGGQPFAQTAFEKRASLYDTTIAVTPYTFTNTTGKTFYLSLDDAGQHRAELTVEEMVRRHQARPVKRVEWRIAPVRDVSDHCPKPGDWQTVTTVLNFTNDGWREESAPAPIYRETITLDSDKLPAGTAEEWRNRADFDNVFASANSSNFWSSLSYKYDYLVAVGSNPARVSDWRQWRLWDGLLGDTRTCGDASYFQERVVDGYESLPGYPLNEQTTFAEAASFATTGFAVNDDTLDEAIEPFQGWFRIPAAHAVTVYKLVTTPKLTVYDDHEVGDPEGFRSYAPKRYDKSIRWEVQRPVTFTVAHDGGEGNLFAVSSRSFAVGDGVEAYSLER